MKQSAQKSKLCVRSIVCINIMYGKILWIFPRLCTCITDVAIGEQVYCISNMYSHVVATGATILIYAVAETSFFNQGTRGLWNVQLILCTYVDITFNIQQSEIRRFQAV